MILDFYDLGKYTWIKIFNIWSKNERGICIDVLRWDTHVLLPKKKKKEN